MLFKCRCHRQIFCKIFTFGSVYLHKERSYWFVLLIDYWVTTDESMRKHQPQASTWRLKFLPAFVLGEAVLFITAYYFYHKMNTSIEWRLYMLKNHKWALDTYYYIGEKGGYKTREHDYGIWGIKDKSS